MVSARDWFKIYHYTIALKIIHFIKTVICGGRLAGHDGPAVRLL
jgi:hypothetical protein